MCCDSPKLNMMQGETGAAALAALATSTVELSDDDKVTIFAPEDAAWPPAADLPTGGDLLDVRLPVLPRRFHAFPVSASVSCLPWWSSGDMCTHSPAVLNLCLSRVTLLSEFHFFRFCWAMWCQLSFHQRMCWRLSLRLMRFHLKPLLGTPSPQAW